MVCAFLQGGAVAMAQGFAVTVKLRDGKKIEGRIPSERITFDAISSSGERVTVIVEKPPSWAASIPACDIQWSAERNRFVVRTVSWTGELLRLWDRLLFGANGGVIVISGKDVSEMQFLFKPPA